MILCDCVCRMSRRIPKKKPEFNMEQFKARMRVNERVDGWPLLGVNLHHTDLYTCSNTMRADQELVTVAPIMVHSIHAAMLVAPNHLMEMRFGFLQENPQWQTDLSVLTYQWYEILCRWNGMYSAIAEHLNKKQYRSVAALLQPFIIQRLDHAIRNWKRMVTSDHIRPAHSSTRKYKDSLNAFNETVGVDQATWTERIRNWLPRAKTEIQAVQQKWLAVYFQTNTTIPILAARPFFLLGKAFSLFELVYSFFTSRSGKVGSTFPRNFRLERMIDLVEEITRTYEPHVRLQGWEPANANLLPFFWSKDFKQMTRLVDGVFDREIFSALFHHFPRSNEAGRPNLHSGYHWAATRRTAVLITIDCLDLWVHQTASVMEMPTWYERTDRNLYNGWFKLVNSYRSSIADIQTFVMNETSWLYKAGEDQERRKSDNFWETQLENVRRLLMGAAEWRKLWPRALHEAFVLRENYSLSLNLRRQ